MRIGLHLIIEMLLALAAICLFTFVPVMCGLALKFSFPWPFALLGFLVGVDVSNLVRWWFRKIPARCPKCKGRTFAIGSRPIRYKCEECGYLHRTGWSLKGYKGIFHLGD